jgi:hypothetical protein
MQARNDILTIALRQQRLAYQAKSAESLTQNTSISTPSSAANDRMILEELQAIKSLVLNLQSAQQLQQQQPRLESVASLSVNLCDNESSAFFAQQQETVDLEREPSINEALDLLSSANLTQSESKATAIVPRPVLIASEAVTITNHDHHQQAEEETKLTEDTSASISLMQSFLRQVKEVASPKVRIVRQRAKSLVYGIRSMIRFQRSSSPLDVETSKISIKSNFTSSYT